MYTTGTGDSSLCFETTSSTLNSSTTKNKKNGSEKNEKSINYIDISTPKSNLSKSNIVHKEKKILNGGPINKNKKIEIVNINKGNTIEKNNKINGNKKNYIKLNIKGNIKKGIKMKDIYSMFKNSRKNNTSINNILKVDLTEQNCISNRSECINHINYNTNLTYKVKSINNYNKLNKDLLLKRPLS